MDLKSHLPVILRYALVTALTALATRGWISPENQAILSQNVDVIVGAFGALAVVGYALFKRPSSKALEVAKQVDAKVPKGDAVIIKTPGSRPDIVVQPKPGE